MSLRKEPSYQKECLKYRCTNWDCGRYWRSSHSWRQCRKYCSQCKTEGVPIDLVDHKLVMDNFKCQSCGSFWQEARKHKEVSIQRQLCKCGKLVSAKAYDREKWPCRRYWWKCPKDECGKHWSSISFDREFAQLCRECKSRGAIVTITLPKPPRDVDDDESDEDDNGGPHEKENCQMCMYMMRNGNPNGCLKAKKVEYSLSVTQSGGGSNNTMSKLQVVERLDWIGYSKKKA